MNIGDKIFELRKSLQMTQQQFADATGISQSAINFWENGKRHPRYDQLKKISQTLKVPLSHFLEDELFDAATLPDVDEDKILDQKISEILDNKHLSDKEKQSQLKELEVKMGIMQNIHEGNVYGANIWIVKQYFKKLNFDGQEKAIEQIELLTKIPEYQKTPED